MAWPWGIIGMGRVCQGCCHIGLCIGIGRVCQGLGPLLLGLCIGIGSVCQGLGPLLQPPELQPELISAPTPPGKVCIC